MNNETKIKVDIIPKSSNMIYEQRESGMTHSSFQSEYNLYRAIEAGDVDKVKQCITNYIDAGLTVGHLSDNNLHQVRYWCIACISVAIHYSILGGLDETDAFNLSDGYIQHIDKITTMEEAVSYLKEKAVELTLAVWQSQLASVSSEAIRKCIHYIHVHLHERLRIHEIAEQIGLSRDYLSKLFKKETNITLHQYILNEKLKEALLLIENGTHYDAVCYDLGFSSETHFITCFKKKYNMTPKEYIKQQNIDKKIT